MNMMWEWGWLPDGDPADNRLQQYFGLVLLKKEYIIEWPGQVPPKLRFAIAWDKFYKDDAVETGKQALEEYIIL